MIQRVRILGLVEAEHRDPNGKLLYRGTTKNLATDLADLYVAEAVVLKTRNPPPTEVITKMTGIAVDDAANGIYEVIQHETAIDLPTS